MWGMRVQELYSRFLRTLRNFGSARRGNVAITFAFVSLPLIGGVGVAVDYNRATLIKASMQSAIDSVALTLAKNAGNLTASELQRQGEKYFNALFTRHDAKNPKIKVVSNAGSSTIQIDGVATMDTSLLSVLGIKKVDINATATAAWASQTYLRVALVLDNTGSMADAGKMPALQIAAKNMLSKLASADTATGAVYVSIIPFVKDVNLGAGNYNASWLDWTDWDETKGKCSDTHYTTKSSCLSHAHETWTGTAHNKWNGCVVDRGDAGGPNPGNYDANVVAPTSAIPATLYVPEQYSSCPQAAIGLSDDWSAMT